MYIFVVKKIMKRVIVFYATSDCTLQKKG